MGPQDFCLPWIDWLFIVLSPAQELFTYVEMSPLPVKDCKIRPMLDAQGLWAGRDLYRATPTVTWDLGFFRSHPKDRPIQSHLTTHKGVWMIYSNPDPHGFVCHGNWRNGSIDQCTLYITKGPLCLKFIRAKYRLKFCSHLPITVSSLYDCHLNTTIFIPTTRRISMTWTMLSRGVCYFTIILVANRYGGQNLWTGIKIQNIKKELTPMYRRPENRVLLP
jgi:hypothetical protein